MAYRMRRKFRGLGKIAAVEHGCGDRRADLGADDVEKIGGGDDEEAPASEPHGSTSVSTNTSVKVRPHSHGSTSTSASCESVGSGQGRLQRGARSRASDDRNEAGSDDDQVEHGQEDQARTGAISLPGAVAPVVHCV